LVSTGENRRDILNFGLNEQQTQAQMRDSIIRGVQRALVEARADALKTELIQELRPVWIANLSPATAMEKS
jgi:hypothetical protein